MDINEILKLSASKRILLAQQIWDSIPEKDIEPSQAIKDELDVRLDAHHKGEMNYYTREEVKRKLSDKK